MPKLESIRVAKRDEAVDAQFRALNPDSWIVGLLQRAASNIDVDYPRNDTKLPDSRKDRVIARYHAQTIGAIDGVWTAVQLQSICAWSFTIYRDT